MIKQDSSPHNLPPQKQRLALLALALGGFTIGTTEFATMGILTNISDALDVSIPSAGHAITAYALGVVIGAPVIAILTARMSRTALVVALMGAYSVANLLSSFATSLEMLMVGRFIAGLPHGVFFGVGAVVGTAVVGAARRGHAMSMMLGGLTIANVVGVPLSSWVGATFGWRMAFILVGVLGFVAMGTLLACLPKVAPEKGASPKTEIKALKNGPLWGVFLASGIGFGGMFAIYSYIKPLVMFEAGMSESSVPWVLSLFGIGMTVGIYFAGRMMDKDTMKTTITGFISTAAAMVFVPFAASHPVTLLIAVFAVGFTAQFLAMGLQGLLMDLSPKAPSLGAALCHSALNTANAAGAFFGGLVITWGFGYASLGWLGLILTAIGLGLTLWFTPRKDARDVTALLDG